MAGIAAGEEIFDEDKSSWERRIVAPVGTQLSFACNRAENFTALHTDFEQFYCEIYDFPELHVLPFELAFYLGEQVQLKEEFVGAVSEGFRRSLTAEIYESLEDDAKANNGRAMVLVHTHQHSRQLYIFYYIQDFTIQVTMEKEEQISYDVVQDQYLMHTITEDSDDESENEVEEYFGDSESSEIGDESDDDFENEVEEYFGDSESSEIGDESGDDSDNEVEEYFGDSESSEIGDEEAAVLPVNTSELLLPAQHFGSIVYTCLTSKEEGEAPEIGDEEAAEILGSLFFSEIFQN